MLYECGEGRTRSGCGAFRLTTVMPADWPAVISPLWP